MSRGLGDVYKRQSSCSVIYVFKLQEKLITEPNPYLSTKTGLSVEPPKSDTRKGQDEINIICICYLLNIDNVKVNLLDIR